MHSEDDENYHRGYEWYLMVQAKKVNLPLKFQYEYSTVANASNGTVYEYIEP